ncbi:EAL domain-containing protein [Pseudomonas aeruginosa]
MQYENHNYQYQPIVDMQSLALVRYEALLRVPGIKNIEDYIKGLEHSGGIVELDLNTIRTVISDAERSLMLRPTPVAVNISAISLNDSYFQTEVLKLLRARKMRVALSLEITETAPIKNTSKALQFVRKLHGAACTVGMDDYGSGHANLDLIEELGLDYIKLASNITREVVNNKNARNLCRNAIMVANEQCIDVVAEFIDDEEQYELLRKMGAHLGQGWLFAKADRKLLDVPAFEASLRKRLKVEIAA